MTLVTLNSPFAWPGMIGHLNNAPGPATAQTLSSAGHYVAYVGAAMRDMTISHIGFRCGTSTGSPVMEVRVETVDSSGLPSGTLWATDTNASTGTLTSNSNPLTALTASASITKGQVFCIKLLFSSGTSQVIQHLGSAGPGITTSNFPYTVNNTGSPTKAAIANYAMIIALGSSSTAFYPVPGMFPVSSGSAGTFNNTNSAKRGLRFTIPFNCRAVGIRWYNSNSTGDYNAVLFSDAGSELSSSSTAYDGDYGQAGTGNSVNVFFDNAVSLTRNTTYRIAIEPTSATNVNVSTITLPSADYMSATPGGAAAHYTTFASGSWTDSSTNVIPWMDLLIDQIDDGAGSGSSVVGVIGG